MTFERIKEIIIDQLALDESTVITMDTVLTEDLEADSLDAVEIIMSIEDEYGIEIPDDVATEFKSIKDIVDYVDSVKEA